MHTVLVADDNDINLKLMLLHLKRLGYAAIGAADGAAAVAAFKAQATDAVLMDLEMPVMDGFEATRQIRALSPQVPILALTGHAWTDVSKRCADAGFSEYIQKPFTSDTLAKALNAALAAPPG
jgi:CheY-like chemotaxis protein